jgi:hypothetical protein
MGQSKNERANESGNKKVKAFMKGPKNNFAKNDFF